MKKIKDVVKYTLTLISPKLKTKIAYRIRFHKKLNLKNPKTINEKILYLQLYKYNNNQLITNCIDKYKIREYLKKKKLTNILPELYGVYNNANEIDWNKIPNSFVAKCNHGCGYNLIVPDKSKINLKEAEIQLNKWLQEDYWKGGEIQYRYIEKKIIIEEYLGEIETYKFYCFNGNPLVMYVSSNYWHGGICEKDKFLDYFDMNFKHIDCNLDGHENNPNKIKKPKNFDKMVELSKKLSSDFPFVRVDLYDANGKIYISELTFIPTGGMMKIEPESKLLEWGKWLKL